MAKNGQNAPQNGFMIFVPSKVAKHVTSSCFISNRRLKGLHWEMFITTYVCYDCKLASVAEWIRQCTRNPEIVGSIPLEGKLFLIFFYLLRG